MYVVGGWRGKGWAIVAAVAAGLVCALSGCARPWSATQADAGAAYKQGRRPSAQAEPADTQWTWNTDSTPASREPVVLPIDAADWQSGPSDLVRMAALLRARVAEAAEGAAIDEASSTECAAVVAGVLVPGLLPPDASWEGARLREASSDGVPAIPVAWTPVAGTLESGTRVVRCEGELVRTATAIGLARRLTAEGALEDLDAMLPQALLAERAWEGKELGPGSRRELAGGWVWTNDMDTEGAQVVRIAPPSMHVTSWCDGKTCLLVASGVTAPVSFTSSVVGRPDFLSDPTHPANLGNEFAIGEGPAVTLAAPEDPQATARALPASIRERLSGLPEGMQASPQEPGAWSEASLRPVPPQVAERLGLPAALECPTMTLGNGGRVSAGLLDLAADQGWHPALAGPVEWTLGEGFVSVTAFSAHAIAEEERSPGVGRGTNWRAIASQRLPLVLGETGRRLASVPCALEEREGGAAAVLTPNPDTEVGLIERVRVGDTPWGRCRIYVDPEVLHVVFDLVDAE